MYATYHSTEGSSENRYHAVWEEDLRGLAFVKCTSSQTPEERVQDLIRDPASRGFGAYPQTGNGSREEGRSVPRLNGGQAPGTDLMGVGTGNSGGKTGADG